MNLSHYLKITLFAPFFAYFKATFWPTYSSMACEAALKSTKNYTQRLSKIGIDS